MSWGETAMVRAAGLAPVSERGLRPGWKWRERTGVFVSPTDMETRHLFYTLRMIWNNSQPARMHVGHPVRLYSFRPFYTPRYFAEAIVAIGAELLTRTDMKTEWKAQLEQIRAWSAASSTVPATRPVSP